LAVIVAVFPFRSWLKIFRAKERVDEIDEKRDGDESEQKSLKHQLASFVPSLLQPAMYAMARMKKATLAVMHPMSHMGVLSFVRGDGRS
jgi:hypothetical protein